MSKLLVLVAIGAVVALLSFMYAATTAENNAVSASLTVNSFVDTSINVSSITFGPGPVDPNTSLAPADSSINLTNTANSNTVVDVYLNNTNMTNGSNYILYNYTSVNTVNNNATITRLNGSTYINGTSANSGFVENLGIGSSQVLWFWQDVPAGQAAGSYSETINIRSVKDGEAP